MLVLATMWPTAWGQLKHPTRDFLNGFDITVPPSFSAEVVDSLEATVGADPRLLEAAKRARDGEVTQYLAGAPDLLDRYQKADDAPKALLTAAMDIRRLGHGPAIPRDLLWAGTTAYLTIHQWENVSQNRKWLDKAVDEATKPCHGNHRPLSRIRAKPGEREPEYVSYRLADYLDQIGRQTRDQEIPKELWQALVNHVKDPTSAGSSRPCCGRADALRSGHPSLTLRRRRWQRVCGAAIGPAAV